METDVTASESGPFLVSALICERVLTDQDKVHSLIRIVDRTVVGTSGPQSRMEMPKFPAQLSMFLAFKAGDARGSETVKVTLTRPNGLTDPEPIAEQSLHLEGGTRGANLVLQMTIGFDEPGPYWFNIYIADKLMTKTPYEIIHQHTRVRQTGEGAS